jgi:hypothetical protein
LNLLRSWSRRVLAATAISILAAAAIGALVSPASAGGTQLSIAAFSAFRSPDYGVFNGLIGPESTTRSGKTTVRDRNTRDIFDERRRLLRLGVLPEDRDVQPVRGARRRRDPLRLRAGRADRGVQLRLHGDARGRSLARAGAHLRTGLPGPRRLRRRHSGGGYSDERPPDRQRHVHRAGHGPDPQLHGLLGRPCYNQFTAGQETRMQEQFLHWRVGHGY